MDPLLMVGGWAAALMSLVAALRFFYTLLLRGLRSVIKDELASVWVDMQAAEDRSVTSSSGSTGSRRPSAS